VKDNLTGPKDAGEGREAKPPAGKDRDREQKEDREQDNDREWGKVPATRGVGCSGKADNQ